MADDVVVNPSTGVSVQETIAFDEIAGKKYERIKLIHGADGVNAGDVADGNPYPTKVMSALPAGTNNIGRAGSEYTSGVISNADVDALEEVATILVSPYKTLFVTFTVGTSALTDFDIDARSHASGSYVTLFGASADYLFPQGALLWVSGDLTVAPTSGVHGFILDVSSFESVRISAAGTSSVVAGHYGAK